jgi:plastocyanin
LKKLTALLAICALVPFGLAACGDDEDETTAETTAEETTADTGGGGGEVVSVAAAPDGSFAFEEDTLEAAPGAATFEFTNDATLGHDFCLEDPSGEDVGCTEVIAEDSTTLDADLEAGDYTYYCDVAGHREGGMEGTLTVK